MRQLVEYLDSGELRLIEVPRPSPRDRHVVVETRATVVSAGTERMLLEFGEASLLRKALDQPERAKEVLAKARSDGLAATWEAVKHRLEEPLPLGYCQAGQAIDVGTGCEGIEPGDRVVTNGPHAECVQVAHTLAARIPEAVSYEEAAFTPLGAVALQGIRNASPELGETVVVFGLGLVGLLTVQLLRAQGCRVLGLEPREARRELARRLGAEVHPAGSEAVDWVRSQTDGWGADAVLLTLVSDSNVPVRQAAEMSRERGRLVLVGVTGLELRREDFYEKELSFSVSRSYGPGRYDPTYEEQGRDYPLAYVRWTARRNFDAFLRLMAEGDVDVEPLISHRFPFRRAPEAYDEILDGGSGLGIVLTYDEAETDGGDDTSIDLRPRGPAAPADRVVAGVIGAGGFAQRVMLPILSELPVQKRTIAAPSGTSAGVAGRRFGFDAAASAPNDVFEDSEINTVFVLTRHDSHAELAVRALEAGKHVFVEKPLALTAGELSRIESALRETSCLLTVGFNRRFAPAAVRLREHLEGRAGPVSLQISVNAGRLDAEHWLLDPAVGGGRLVGEGCHFVDLARYLVGAPVPGWDLRGTGAGVGPAGNDPWHLGLDFEDESVATVRYAPVGSSSYPKERVEASFDGQTFVIDNWRRLKGYGAGPLLSLPGRQDKGHAAELEAWVEAVTDTGEPPIPYDELFEVSRITLEAAGRGDASP